MRCPKTARACALLLGLLCGASVVSVVGAARLLRQDNVIATYTSVKGQRPLGNHVVTDWGTTASAGSSIKGLRYNAGRVTYAGDLLPGAAAASSTVYNGHKSAATHSGIPVDATVNLGIQAMAATSEGARAVAGSGTMFTGENGRGTAISSDTEAFRAVTSRNRGSIALTDTAAKSAATAGMGDGPVAMAWGLEVSSFARASRDAPLATDKMQRTKHHNTH